jgi:hypothetical protein
MTLRRNRSYVDDVLGNEILYGLRIDFDESANADAFEFSLSDQTTNRLTGNI